LLYPVLESRQSQTGGGKLLQISSICQSRPNCTPIGFRQQLPAAGLIFPSPMLLKTFKKLLRHLSTNQKNDISDWIVFPDDPHPWLEPGGGGRPGFGPHASDLWIATRVVFSRSAAFGGVIFEVHPPMAGW
jgi:hypothetical protein